MATRVQIGVVKAAVVNGALVPVEEDVFVGTPETITSAPGNTVTTTLATPAVDPLVPNARYMWRIAVETAGTVDVKMAFGSSPNATLAGAKMFPRGGPYFVASTQAGAKAAVADF